MGRMDRNIQSADRFATGGAESFFSLAIAPGGSIVAGGFTFTGSANDRAIAARMGADGKPDLSFNATGRYITSFPGTQGARSVGMILQKYGKLTQVALMNEINWEAFRIYLTKLHDKETKSAAGTKLWDEQIECYICDRFSLMCAPAG